MEGMRFGRLVVVKFFDVVGPHKRWMCVCDCGNETVVWQLSLRKGTTKSCGCLRSDTNRERRYREPDFWKRIEKTDACWNWVGEKDGGGYGRTRWEGKCHKAHRIAWRLLRGKIPAGLFVLHHCDNRSCCNPEHLYLGTQADNMRDMVERKRRKGIGCGEKNGRSKLTQEQAEAICLLYAAGQMSQQKIANQFGVSQFAVSAIVRNKRYV